jgi:hypothetical protein
MLSQYYGSSMNADGKKLACAIGCYQVIPVGGKYEPMDNWDWS